MKILIDCSLIDPQERGMGIYIKNILPAIDEFPQHQFYLITNNFFGKDYLEKKFFLKDNVFIIFHKSNKLIFEQFLIPYECYKKRIDLLFSSGDTASIINLAKKQILIIHDVLYMKRNSFESKGNTIKRRLGRIYRKVCIAITSKYCHKIITVSSFAKKDIQRELGVPSKNVHIIKNGINTQDEVDRDQFHRKSKKILFVSGSDNQKNISPVLKQLIRDDDLFSKFSSIEIVGISNPSEIYLDENQNVNFHGYLDHKDLNKLYKECSHFIVPSLYESFGIPALEALHSGCMVYSSNLGALPEIMKDKAFYFDPSDLDSILMMIKHLKENYENYSFQDYLEAREYTKTLTWQDSRQEFIEFLSSNLSRKILVIGDGLIGSTLIHAIGSKNNYEIHLSSEKSKVKKIGKIFDADIPISYSGSGGLGNFWHSVLDFSNLNIKDISGSFLLKKLINEKEDLADLSNSEFVPYFPIRPRQLLKSKKFFKKKAAKLLDIKENKKVLVTFMDDTKETYDQVFICHGSFPETDVLINSGLAERSTMISDHLVAQVSGLKFKEDYTKVKFLKKGHLRKYQVASIHGTNFKFSYRPIYNKNEDDFSHKDKAIYSKNIFLILIKMLTSFNFSFLKQSLYLRFGINFKSKNWITFTQFFCKDSYIYENGNFKINKDKIDKEIKKLHELGLKVEMNSLMSGIHYSNVYSYLSDDIAVNELSKFKSIILFGSNFKYNGNEKHFTFNLMLKAEKIGIEICQKA